MSEMTRSVYRFFDASTKCRSWEQVLLIIGCFFFFPVWCDDALEERYAGAAISKVCLAYLLHFDEKALQTDILQCYPFAIYSATYWLINAARAKYTDNETLQLIEQLLNSSGGAYKICYDLHRPDQSWHKPYRATIW